jgi:predicted transcriptional regulator
MSFKHLLGAKPDPTLHNPDAAYIRSLVDACGLTQAQAAEAIDISERAMRYYLSTTTATFRPAPYAVQFTLEQLAAHMDAVKQ